MTQNDNTKLFFFFGSLRRGYWNNTRLSNTAQFLGDGKSLTPFSLYVGARGTVPTCCPDPKGVPLVGELYALGERDAASVYMLETGYKSGTFKVKLNDAEEEVEAVIFYHDSPKACYYISGEPVLIPSGDYADKIGRDGEIKTILVQAVLPITPSSNETASA